LSELRHTRATKSSKSKQNHEAANSSKIESKTLNYVMLNKKRGLGDLQHNAEIGQQQSNNKKLKNQLDLNNINVIDVISSEYVHEEPSTLEETASSSHEKKKAISERITCNGIEMHRETIIDNREKSKIEKIDSHLENNEQYIYDIYIAKNTNINLDFLYANNYEIKSYKNEDLELELLNEKCDRDDEQEGI
jgi:hypothetical protein